MTARDAKSSPLARIGRPHEQTRLVSRLKEAVETLATELSLPSVGPSDRPVPRTDGRVGLATSAPASLDQLWADTGADYLLRGHRSFQDYFDSLLWSDSAFRLLDREMRCMDEGLSGGKRRAGSGILDDNAENDCRGKVTGYTSHESCAAALVYVRRKGIKTADPDGAAEERIREIARAQGVPFTGRIPIGELRRPPERHIARALYYCWVDFDPSQVPGLAPGFVLSRDTISDAEQAIREGKIALEIALDRKTGFGSKLSQDNPFFLVAVLPGGNEALKASTLDELARIAGGNSAVRIDVVTGRK